jgi:hypothetical protein
MRTLVRGADALTVEQVRHEIAQRPRATAEQDQGARGKTYRVALDRAPELLEELAPSAASQPDPQDDLYELLNAIDQLISLLETKNGPLRGDIAKLYSVILARVKAARPANPFVSTLSVPQETAMSGIYRTTIGEAVAGLSLMRSALLSAS